jgi:hypothetical protein
VVETRRLESVRALTGTGGSNPSLSAKQSCPGVPLGGSLFSVIGSDDGQDIPELRGDDGSDSADGGCYRATHRLKANTVFSQVGSSRI